MLISNSPKRGTTVRDISNGSLVLTFKTCQQASLASVKVAEKKVRSSALIGQTLFLSFSCLGDFIWTITFTVLKPNLENDSPFFQLNRLCKMCAEMDSLCLAEAPEHLSNTAVLPPTSRGPLGANWGESCTGVRYARLHPCQGAVSRDWQPRRDAGAEPGSASIAARVLRILGAVTVCFFHSLTFTFETSLHVNVEEKKKVLICILQVKAAWRGGIMWPGSRWDEKGLSAISPLPKQTGSLLSSQSGRGSWVPACSQLHVFCCCWCCCQAFVSEDASGVWPSSMLYFPFLSVLCSPRMCDERSRTGGEVQCSSTTPSQPPPWLLSVVFVFLPGGLSDVSGVDAALVFFDFFFWGGGGVEGWEVGVFCLSFIRGHVCGFMCVSSVDHDYILFKLKFYSCFQEKKSWVVWKKEKLLMFLKHE